MTIQEDNNKRKQEEKEINELCFEILDIGYLDLKALNEYIKMGELFTSDFICDVKEEINELYPNLKITNENGELTNALFYGVIDRLFYLICDELEELEDITEEEKEKIESLKDNFNPFINALDSWFNNIFDEIIEDDTKENIIKNARELLKDDELKK